MLALRVYGLQASAFFAMLTRVCAVASCGMFFSTLKLRLRRKSAKISQVFPDEHFFRLERSIVNKSNWLDLVACKLNHAKT